MIKFNDEVFKNFSIFIDNKKEIRIKFYIFFEEIIIKFDFKNKKIKSVSCQNDKTYVHINQFFEFDFGEIVKYFKEINNIDLIELNNVLNGAGTGESDKITEIKSCDNCKYRDIHNLDDPCLNCNKLNNWSKKDESSSL